VDGEGRLRASARTGLGFRSVVPRRKSPSREPPTPVEWAELPPPRQVLDWRKRTAAFGINPSRTDEEDDPVDERAEAPDPEIQREDADLVRMYLTQVGRRALLKPAEEAQIGGRLAGARAGGIPVHC